MKVNVRHYILNKATGIAGIVLVVCGYWLLWISPDAAMDEVLLRTRISIIINFAGVSMILYYLYRKQS